MKKVIVLLVLAACAAGCGGPASKSGVWKHETLYKSVDHMWFSWGGFKDPTVEQVEKSMAEGWWGTEVSPKSGK